MILDIPLVPPSLNVLKRKYRTFHAYKQLRKLWETNLWHASGSARVNQELLRLASGHRVVTITIYHVGRFDKDNLYGACKVCCDALKNIGFIKDDSAEWLTLNVDQVVVGRDKKTTVKIEQEKIP